MRFIEKYIGILHKGVGFVEVFIYTISFIIIVSSTIKATAIYIKEYNKPLKAFDDTRIILGEAVALALSYILGLEILKLFYIKTFNQLFFVVILASLKLTINHFVLIEIDKTARQCKPELQHK